MRILSLITVLCFLSVTPAQAQEKVFNAESFALENGMQVVVIPNHRAPVITHMVWYKVGAADEKWGKSGIAHFLEHLMFKGTDKIPSGEFSKQILALGGNNNAFTTQDSTAYFESISVDNLETVMEMEADRMRGMNPPPNEVDSERKVILEERRQRTDNDPRSAFGEQMNYALYPNHPYGMPVIGWLNEMAKISWDDVKSFYDTWYAPNNAILVVSGDITAKQLKPLAEKIYGELPAGSVPERSWPKIPPMPGNYRIMMNSDQVRQPALYITFRAPSVVENKPDSLALDVLQEIMSGGASTRLYKSLVVEQKLATSVSLSYDGYYVGDTDVWLSAYPAEGVTLEQLQNALLDELRKLIKDGVTDKELQEAKDRMIDAAIYARDSLQGPAMVFGRALAVGATIDDVEYWPRDINKVTTGQVQNVAATYLNPDDSGKRPSVTGYLIPAESEDKEAGQ